VLWLRAQKCVIPALLVSIYWRDLEYEEALHKYTPPIRFNGAVL
jgi:hypothetical protein